MEDWKVKEQFIELRAQGMSFDRIAKELNLAKQTLINWSKELTEVIENVKATELEALYEKYHVSKEERIKAFGEQLQSIKAELDKRDLSDIPTDKLYQIMAKYYMILRDEVTLPVVKSEEEMEISKQQREFIKTISRL